MHSVFQQGFRLASALHIDLFQGIRLAASALHIDFFQGSRLAASTLHIDLFQGSRDTLQQQCSRALPIFSALPSIRKKVYSSVEVEQASEENPFKLYFLRDESMESTLFP